MKFKLLSLAISSAFLTLSGLANAQTTLTAAVDYTLRNNPRCGNRGKAETLGR